MGNPSKVQPRTVRYKITECLEKVRSNKGDSKERGFSSLKKNETSRLFPPPFEKSKKTTSIEEDLYN